MVIASLKKILLTITTMTYPSAPTGYATESGKRCSTKSQRIIETTYREIPAITNGENNVCTIEMNEGDKDDCNIPFFKVNWPMRDMPMEERRRMYRMI